MWIVQFRNKSWEPGRWRELPALHEFETAAAAKPTVVANQSRFGQKFEVRTVKLDAEQVYHRRRTQFDHMRNALANLGGSFYEARNALQTYGRDSLADKLKQMERGVDEIYEQLGNELIELEEAHHDN